MTGNKAENKEGIQHKPFKKVGNRRRAREATLQMLYLCDNCKFTSQDSHDIFWKNIKMPDPSYDFAKHLFDGTWENKNKLDELIINCVQNWQIERLATIDRNILRLAAFEIINMPETPISVIIDEAVEIAKMYSTPDSGKFVNGILDKLKHERKVKHK